MCLYILPMVESFCHTFCIQFRFEVWLCGMIGLLVYTCLLSSDPLKLGSAPNRSDEIW